MIATRITSFFLLAFTFGSVTAVPVHKTDVRAALVKRASAADVVNVLNTLKQTTTSVASTINDLVASNDATESNVSPVLGELKTALVTASSSLAAVEGGVASTPDHTVAEIADIAREIITKTLETLNTIQTVAGVAGLIADIDKALSQVMVGLDAIIAGVRTLVSSLLAPVFALLRGLKLPHLLSSLGL